ncbi:MAG TPA: type II toxin-antitoxin system Phd/YefM family antitoxin [Candidatus Acidoferrum sp.]|nr:type II toxin-antitoxin system Phd/YefM family antitoxin [Candidatus Acidoferrum sp.]
MAIWQLQEAKARFSELVNAVLKRGPQVISRRGIPTAVLVPIEEWRRLQENSRPSLKELLLRKEPRFEDIVPPRGKLRLRPAPEFE